MQEQAIHVVRLQIPQRSPEGLSHLLWQRCRGVVWNPCRVMTRQGGELGLQVQVGPREPAARYPIVSQAGVDSLAHAALVIVLRLARRIDPAESAADCRLDEAPGVGFFPRGAVEERRDASLGSGSGAVDHVQRRLRERLRRFARGTLIIVTMAADIIPAALRVS